ncbi:MAG TPA: biopolymer transporter ExbD [Spirochaetota bacterium]|nr:biopolymer transporter ExbD [Spirochaetota bacterium]HPI91009.1 biopolymer transporter ExbD [Spirochaetota bacterium]HPR48610.1 biopolymer transporter ExbD [Spirochaetota bacterium]
MALYNKSFITKLRPVAIGSAMADLALLLLIFFMATTSTEPPKGVDVELPHSITRSAEQDNIYITVSRNGEYYFEGTRVSPQQLNDNLAMRQSEKDRVVAITADKNLEYAVINELLELLRDQDFLNIVFMSQTRKEGDGE